MIVKIEKAETELLLSKKKNNDWEEQLKELKETFNNFYLLRYELKDVDGFKYNYFKFNHEVEIIDNSQ